MPSTGADLLQQPQELPGGTAVMMLPTPENGDGTPGLRLLHLNIVGLAGTFGPGGQPRYE